MQEYNGIPTRPENDLRDFFQQITEEGIRTDYYGVAYDIRGMRNLNDQLGRNAGTDLMRAHAQGLQNLIGVSGMVARKSGDAYVALFTRSHKDEVIDYLKNTEVSAMGGSVLRNISCHAGYYGITELCTNYEDLNEILNEALRLSRTQASTEMFAFCDDTVMQKLNERREIAGMFADALANEEFLVFYQPKVETKRYRMKGAEALCRWKHNGEMILPFRFIPVYEQNGDICKLDFYMLEHVCRDLARWQKEGKEIVRVSVNLSREHMGDPRLVEHIVEIIDRNHVPHEYIEIELTETSSEVDYMELKNIVNSLHDAGICTSVDDFGVAYSSMNLLIEYPWDVVKIDRSFVPLGTDDEEDKKRLIMLQAIVSIARQLDIECIAEGVETVEQLLILKKNGCNNIQGYFFDRPMPSDQFEERLDALKEL
ncbi:MAG: EAL domain-containing protein [Lachnospiraceae bacterium]|nr:EAL domain-containing protein [Lachnospiraceae bacterium]